MRAQKLLKLGIALEYTKAINYEEEIILGHLFNINKISFFEKNRFSDLGKKILETLDHFDKNEKKNLTSSEAKARNHFLITRGALFEIAKVDEHLNVILGFLMSLHNKNEVYYSRCYQEGRLYFLKKERQYAKKF